MYCKKTHSKAAQLLTVRVDSTGAPVKTDPFYAVCLKWSRASLSNNQPVINCRTINENESPI